MHSLIQSAKDSPKGFCLLYDRYVQASYRYTYLRVANQADAQDIVSHCWEKVLLKIKTLRSDEEKAFCAWLFRILRNEITEWYRNKGRQSLPLEEHEDLSAKDPSPFEEQLENERSHELHLLLERLTPLQREIMGLRFFADMKNTEIAEFLHLSEEAVAAHVSRGLKMLRKYSKGLSDF